MYEVKNFYPDVRKNLGEFQPTLEALNAPNSIPFPPRGDRPYPDRPPSDRTGDVVYEHENLESNQPSFFGEEEPKPTQSFFPVDAMDNTPTTDIADVRAGRYDYALDKKSPGKDQIYNDIMTGQEDSTRLRQQLADRTELNLKRATMVQKYVQQMGREGVSAEMINEMQKADKATVDQAQQDPRTYYERLFAAKAASDATADIQPVDKEARPITDIVNSYNHVLINQQTARKFYEDALSGMEDRTYGQAAKEWVPFYRYLKLGYASGEGDQDDRGYSLSSKMQAQIDAAYRLSPDKFFESQKEVMKNLSESDPQLAVEYAAALLGYTAGSKFSDYAASALDATLLTPASLVGIGVPLGKLGYKATKALIGAPGDYLANLRLVQASGTMRGLVKQLGGSEVDYIAMLPEARKAQAAAIDSIRRKAAKTGQAADWDDLANTIMPIVNPQMMLTGATNMTAEEAARLEISMMRTATTTLDELVSRPRNLERLSAEEVNVGAERAGKYVDNMYKYSTLGSRIMHVKPVTIEAGQNLANTDAVAVFLGSAKATGFSDAAAAKTAATKLGIEKFFTEEVNGEHYIKLIHYIDETDTTMKGFARSNDKYVDKNQRPWLHPFLSKVRMRDSLVPEQLAEDFKYSQAGTNQYFANVRNQFEEDFSGLNKASRRDLDGYLEREGDFREQPGGPETVVRGRYSRNVGEFQQNFSKDLGRLPTFEETRAYFSWRQWNDADYAMRNLDLTRDMTRMGIQQFEFIFRMPGGQSYYTPKLEGKLLHQFPWDRAGDAGLLVWDASAPWTAQRYRKAYMNDSQRAEVQELIDKGGYRIVHLTPWAKSKVRDLMKSWGGMGGGGEAAEIVRPVVPKKPLTKSEQKIKDITDRKEKYAEMSRTAQTDTEQMFYENMSFDSHFADTMEALGVPQTHWEMENALTDFYSKSTANGGFTTNQNALKASMRRRDFGRPMQEDDLRVQRNRDPNVRNKIVPRQDIANSLNSGRTKVEYTYQNSAQAAENPDPYTQFHEMAQTLTDTNNDKFQVHGLFATDGAKTLDRDLIDLLESGFDPNRPLNSGPPKGGLFGTNSTRTTAPYLLISDPGKTLEETGVKNVILNGPAAISKDYLRKEYPSVNFMDVKEAGRFMKNNKLPKKVFEPEVPKLPPKEYASTSHGFNIGDDAHYTSDDKTIMNAQPAKIERFQDLEGFGPAAFVEGSSSPIPIHNLYRNPGEVENELKTADTLRKKEMSDVKEWFKIKYPDLKLRAAYTKNGYSFTIVDEAAEGGEKVVLNKGSLEEIQKLGYQPIPKSDPVKPHLIEAEPRVPTYDAKTNKLMQGWDTGRFDYVLIKPENDMRASSLDYIRFPYQEGGHKITKDQWHIRQPDIYSPNRLGSKINVYEGDLNAYTAVTEADAREMATHLETMRQALKRDLTNGTDDAEAFYNWKLQGTSKNFKDFKSRFKEFNEQDGHLSLDHKFYVTPRDKSAWDAIRNERNVDGSFAYPNLENQRDSAHNLFSNELNLKFALERSDNLESVVRNGTADAPSFGTQTRGRLSPMTTLANTMSSLIRGRLIDDLKFKSAENFGKSYANVIDASAEVISKDPMRFILNPQWKQGLQGEDLKLLNNAKDYRRALVDFLGIESPGRDTLLTIQRSLAEVMKTRLGEGSYEYVDRHLLRSGTINPIRWANNMVFDLFFGLMNVKQLAVQAMTSFHTAAVLGPVTGVQAGFAAHLARWLIYNDQPERLALIGKWAEKGLGINAAHFSEAVTSLKNSGWHIVGGETALQDDFLNQNIKESFMDRSRDVGRWFFKEGDRFTRNTAYMGAYLEWRGANPKGVLTPRIEKEILNRADTLSLNMTAASNASIAKGAAAIPLKFTTYYLRLMEQMLPGFTGGPLTAMEKARAFGMYSALFGAPIAASGAVGVWPLHKEITKGLIEKGYDTTDDKVVQFFNEGLAGLLPSLITGKHHNFSESLGPSGSSWLYDMYNGRSELFDVITGVAGTKVEDTVENAWPFWTLIANPFRNDDRKYPLAWSDLEMLARSASSVNNVWKSIQMINTGKYMSMNRTPLAEGVNGTDALYSLMFGTQPAETSKAFLMTDMMRSTKAMKDSARKDISRNYRLMMKSVRDDDQESAVHYGKVIKYLVNANGFTATELNRLYSDSVTANGGLVKDAERKFYQSTPDRQKQWLDKIRQQEEAKEPK